MGHNVNEENNYMRVHFLPPENRMRRLLVEEEEEEEVATPAAFLPTEGRVPRVERGVRNASAKWSRRRRACTTGDAFTLNTSGTPPPPPSTR